MPVWKPAYLVHGDDHGRIGERRAGFRAMAERESGAGGIELLEAGDATPEMTAAALNTMTFAIGRRFILVDADDFKDAEVAAHLAPALAALPPETTIAFFVREDGRRKVAGALVKAVEGAGGDVVVHATLRGRELPRWAIGEARRLGVELDGAAAHLLVSQVGERQQRLLRELEKLALEHGAGAAIGVQEVEQAAAISSERQVWGLVDSLVARDRVEALRAYLDLREQGEPLPKLMGTMSRRLRDVLAIALRLEVGESPAQVKASIKGSPWAADQRIKEARAADSESLRDVLEVLAQLELDTRGQGSLDEQTTTVLALSAA